MSPPSKKRKGNQGTSLHETAHASDDMRAFIASKFEAVATRLGKFEVYAKEIVGNLQTMSENAQSDAARELRTMNRTRNIYEKSKKSRNLAQSRANVLLEKISRLDLDVETLKKQLKDMHSTRLVLHEERSQALLVANSCTANEIKALQQAEDRYLDQAKKAEAVQREYDDKGMGFFHLSTAFSRMTAEQIFEQWHLPFLYNSHDLLNYNQAQLLRRCLKMYGYPAAKDLVLKNVGSKPAIWNEICNIVGIEVPADNVDLALRIIQTQYHAIQQEVLVAQQDFSDEENSWSGDDGEGEE